MPKPTAEHKKLALFAGTWEGEEIIHPSPWDPKGFKAIGRSKSRIDLGGFHLIVAYEEERDGKVCFEGHGVYGWDPRRKCYTMYWFDSSGMEHDGPTRGSWEGDTLTFQRETNHMGVSQYVYIVGDGEYQFKLLHSPDGKTWNTFLEGRYRRISK